MEGFPGTNWSNPWLDKNLPHNILNIPSSSLYLKTANDQVPTLDQGSPLHFGIASIPRKHFLTSSLYHSLYSFHLNSSVCTRTLSSACRARQPGYFFFPIPALSILEDSQHALPSPYPQSFCSKILQWIHKYARLSKSLPLLMMWVWSLCSKLYHTHFYSLPS